VARALGYRHVDSGAMYRAVAWQAIQNGSALDDEAAVATLAERVRIEVTSSRVTVDGRDITREIRTPQIDRAAAAVARLPRVRAVLVNQQRAMGADRRVVMEGRDIGTVVFPEADVKIYLDASPEERARRRASDPAHSGPAKVTEVATMLTERDRIDRTRAASPLYAADDAEIVDTTDKDVTAVVSEVLAIVNRRLGDRPGADGSSR
jgi:cytidylate kinase